MTFAKKMRMLKTRFLKAHINRAVKHAFANTAFSHIPLAHLPATHARPFPSRRPTQDIFVVSGALALTLSLILSSFCLPKQIVGSIYASVLSDFSNVRISVKLNKQLNLF